jgi:anti-sigma-K factor RskA
VEHRELQDLIPAHALDALEADDALLLEEHVVTCESCRRDLDDLRETTALLAFAPDSLAPPARLRAAILDAVAEPAPVMARPRRVRLTFLRGAIAGTLAGAAIALVIGIALHARLNDARSSRDAQAAIVANLLAPGSQVAQLSGNVQGAVVRSGSRGRLVLVDLPKPSSGHTYEAWLIGSDRKPLPAGTFTGGDAVVVRLEGDAKGPKTVAITVEPDGGTQAPTTAPVASARLA